MKPVFSILVTAALTAISATMLAQTRPVWERDPTYSVNNYKHSNKAASVHHRHFKSGMDVRVPQSGANQLASYKMPKVGQPPVGGVVLLHTPNQDIASRNYKMPRLTRPVVQLAPALAEKPSSSSSVTTD